MDVIDLLLNSAPPSLPEKGYRLKRLSKEYKQTIVFNLRALTWTRVADIRKFGDEDMNVHIVLAGVTSPDLRSEALLNKYGATTPDDLVKKMLLPGEIDEIALMIERLSGYRTPMLEEVKKNSNQASSSA